MELSSTPVQYPLVLKGDYTQHTVWCWENKMSTSQEPRTCKWV